MEAMSYCRVSTEEQVKEGVSLAAQEARGGRIVPWRGCLSSTTSATGGLRRSTTGHPTRWDGAAAGAGVTPGAACGGGDP